MFDTKIVIVLREGLAPWQALNVTAFLSSGLASQTPGLIGEPYVDRAGNRYNALSIQPMIVLCADAKTMTRIHRRSLDRSVRSSLYIEDMFQTDHDAANRSVFSQFDPEDAKVVGIALRDERKQVDKITRGARLHP